MSTAVRQALVWWVDLVAARALTVVLGAALLTALGLTYALPHLRVDTSTEEMISADVPFRQNRIAFTRAFPDLLDPIVAVVEGATPEQVDQAAGALADALRADSKHFTAVDYSANDPFFATHGLLYLGLDQLTALTDRLAGAQPLLAALAEDPSLRGLAAFVKLALQQQSPGDALPAELDRLLADMGTAVEAQLAGAPGMLSWRRAMQDGRTTAPSRALVVAEPRFDHASFAPAAAAIDALRAHASAVGIDAGRGLRLGITGKAALDDEELAGATSGAVLAAILSTLAVTALLVWGLRSLRLIAATLITLAVGLILTAAVAALTIGRLNLISVTFAVLFVGLAVDFGIHLVLRYREALDREGSHRLALRSAVVGVAGALSLSALCAALGFLGFVPTDYRGLAELGLISASGMAIACLTSLSLLPALLQLMPLRPRRRPLTASRVLSQLQHHPRSVVAVAALGALASLFALPYLSFDFNPLNLKDPNSELMRTLHELAADPATSPEVIDILADNLDQANAIAARLNPLKLVDRAITLSDFVPKAQDAKLELIDLLAFYLGPVLQPGQPAAPLDAAARRQAFEQLRTSLDTALKRRPLAARNDPGVARLAEALDRLDRSAAGSDPPLAELERRLTGTLPDLLHRLRQSLEAGPVTLADLPRELQGRWLNAHGQARVLVQPAAQITDNAALEAYAKAVLGVAPHATGTPVIALEGGDAVVGAFEEASWLALGLITLLLALVMRKPRDILLVLAPLVLAALLTGASAVLLGLSLNFANVIVLPLLLGLGVSGAIHVVMRWHEEAESEAVAATSTPRAVMFSALTTIASFGSLALSSHRGLASMGLLLTIAILWSLVCTLVVLPGMLTLAHPRKPESDAA